MTFNAKETSGWEGKPVELFEFTNGTLSYRYTSAATEQTHNGKVYTPAAIGRGSLNHGPQIFKANLEITVPRDHPVAMLFMAWAPSTVVTVTLYQHHIGEAEC